jgi:hypothetical protein
VNNSLLDAACRRRIVAAGFRITSETDRWVTAVHPNGTKIGNNNVRSLAEWVAERKR